MSNLEKPPQETPELPDLQNLAERHPDWPRFHLSFYFSAHDSDKDTEGIAPYLEQADVLLYEDSISDEDERKQRNMVAAVDSPVSRRRLEKRYAGKSDLPLYLGLYRTGKAAGVIDTGKTPEEVDADEKLTELFEEVTELYKHPLPKGTPYEDALSIYGSKLDEIAELQRTREEKMVWHFEDEMERILTERLDLQERSDLQIIVSIGANHVRVQQLFAQAHLESEANFSQADPGMVSYRSELKRALSRGEMPSDEMIKRSYAEQIIVEAMYRANHSTDDDISQNDMTRYLRDAVGVFNDEQMREVYEVANTGAVPLKCIDRVLEENNRPRLPRTRPELMKILGITDEAPQKRWRKLGRLTLRR